MRFAKVTLYFFIRVVLQVLIVILRTKQMRFRQKLKDARSVSLYPYNQACNQNSAARGAMIFLGGAITYNKFSYGQLKYKL